MGYEVLQELPLEDVEIETLLQTVQNKSQGKKLAIVPILQYRDWGWLMVS